MGITDTEELFLESPKAQAYQSLCIMEALVDAAVAMGQDFTDEERIILARWHRDTGIPGPHNLPTLQ